MALNKPLKKMIWILPTVLIVGVVAVYASSSSLRGKLKVWMWSGKSTLRCSGSDVLVIKGKTADAQHQTIYASGRCKVKIIDSELSGSIAVYANQSARITLINTKLHAKNHALYLGNGTRAVIKGSTLTSKGTGVYLGTGAELTVEKSTITGGRHGVYVGNGARAVIQHSKVHSTKSDAIYASTKSEVVVTAGEFRGKDGIHMGKDANVQITGATFTITGRAFYIGAGARLKVANSKVNGGKDGIYAGNKARVRWSNTNLVVTQRALYCSNDSDVEIANTQLKGDRGAYISNRAKVQLRKVDLRANSTGLYASTRATVVFDGGKLISAGRAIYASNQAKVTLRKVKVVGSIYKSKNAVINRVGEGDSADGAARRAAELAKRIERYKRMACWGVLTCYQRHRQFGKVDVLVEANIDDNGQATKTLVRPYRKVKRKVRRCLERNAKKRRIKDFRGPPGLLHCRVRGTIQDGVQQLRYGTEYRPDPKAPKQTKPDDLPVPSSLAY